MIIKIPKSPAPYFKIFKKNFFQMVLLMSYQVYVKIICLPTFNKR